MSNRDPSHLNSSAEAAPSRASAQEKRERVRRAALTILATNPLAKLTVYLVQQELEIAGLPSTTEETAAALEYLTDLGFLKAQPHWLGATLRYKITAVGTNAHERDGE